MDEDVEGEDDDADGWSLTLLVRGGDEDAVIGRDKESAVTGRPSPVV